MSIVRLTERVLRYHAVAVERGERLVLTPYSQAMADVCERLRRDSSGLQALNQMQALLVGISAPEPQDEAIKQMEMATGQYKSWLQTTFPRECGPVCKWPILKALRGSRDARCEQCGKRGAKVHIAKWSSEGVVRHEYCNECYRKGTVVDHKFG